MWGKEDDIFKRKMFLVQKGTKKGVPFLNSNLGNGNLDNPWLK